MAAWSDNKVTCIITLWSDDAVQEKLEGCKKNRDVFERISKDMREAEHLIIPNLFDNKLNHLYSNLIDFMFEIFCFHT